MQFSQVSVTPNRLESGELANTAKSLFSSVISNKYQKLNGKMVEKSIFDVSDWMGDHLIMICLEYWTRQLRA